MTPDPESWSRADLVTLWVAVGFSALCGLSARMAYRLYGLADLPPEDPHELALWQRRRWWMGVSEFGALPAFATGWSAAALYWHLPIPLVVLGSMGSGALGFGFLLHALQAIVQRRLDNV